MAGLAQSSEASKSAMNEIATRGDPHRIQHPIADESEAMSAFDGITYIKGQASSACWKLIWARTRSVPASAST